MNYQMLLELCSCGICLAFSCLLLSLFLFLQLVAVLTDSYLIGIFILLGAFIYLLREVGEFALYPGSFSNVRGEVEINGGKRFENNMNGIFNAFFQYLHFCQSPVLPPISQRPQIYEFLERWIELLSKFKGTLTQRKQKLFLKLSQIHHFLQGQYQDPFTKQLISIQTFLTSPSKTLKQVQNRQHTQKKIIQYIRSNVNRIYREIGHIMEMFGPAADSGLVGQLCYKLYDEKLYEMRFAYFDWDMRFIYSVYQIDTQDNNTIQCAVIYGFKDPKMLQKPLKKTNQAVILSCPNGGFIQFYVFDCRYAFFYLSMGYNVILWNYRGYGYSTGTPSLSAALTDIENVYHYCRQQLKLDPVIAHGYSIGGPPSIHLAHKYQNEIKLLVADRTFSHVQYIARSISPVLQHLYKWIFYSDAQIQNTKSYLQIRECAKIMIWDQHDEIVADECSLKREAMEIILLEKFNVEENRKKQRLRNQENFEEMQNALSEQLNPRHDNDSHEKQSTQVEFEDSGDEIQSTLSKNKKPVHQIISKTSTMLVQLLFTHLLFFKQQIANSTHQLNATNKNQVNIREQVETQEEMMRQNKTKIKDFLQEIWEKFGEMDGGGVFLFRENMNEYFKHLALHCENYQQFEQFMQKKFVNFLQGLFFFGSFYTKKNSKTANHENCLHNHTAQNIIQQQIEALITKLLENAKVLKEEEQKILKKLMRALRNIQILIESSIEESSREDNRLGLLLPTKSGHNGQIAPQEYTLLKKFIIEKVGCLEISQNEQSMVIES